MGFIGILCLIIISTMLAGQLCQRVGIPSVIGQLLVGVLLGPAMLNWIHPDIVVTDFSEIGVIILMFIAGLESDLKQLRKYLKPGLWVAVIGIIFPVVFCFLIGMMYGFENKSSLFLGITFAATSVSISVEVLKELKSLDTKEGATILGAAVVDDIAVVILLSVIISVLGVKGSEGGGQNLPLALTFLEQALFFVGIFVVVRWGAPFLMRIAEKFTVGSATIIMSLFICLGMAYVADYIGLSSVVGSFFAGVAVAQTNKAEEVANNIEPIGYAVFIPVFFVSVGLNMSFANIGHYLPFIIVLTIVGTLTKLLGGGLGAKIAGFDLDSSYIVGAGMVSRGEMALIIAQIGYEAKLLQGGYYSAVVAVIILTTLFAPFLLKHAIVRQNAKKV